jgi:hypothetical protein
MYGENNKRETMGGSYQAASAANRRWRKLAMAAISLMAIAMKIGVKMAVGGGRR